MSAARPRARRGSRRPPAAAIVDRSSLRALAAWIGLVALVSAGAWLAVAVAADDAFVDTSTAAEPDWARGPLHGLLPGLSGRSFSLLLLIMLAGYGAAVVGADALPRRTAQAAVCGLVVLFGLAPPILSSDLFGYIAYARLDVVHGLNPYLHGPIAAPRDPVLPLVYWRHPSSPYGPLFTLLSLPFGTVSVAVAAWSLKTLETLACLVAVLMLVRAAPDHGRPPAQAAILVGGNPLLLAYGVGGGHNDLLVMAVTVAAICLLRAREPAVATGGAALAVAAGLKLTGGLLAPFALLAGRARGRFAAGALAGAGAAVAVAVAAFGTHFGTTIGQIATSGHFVMAWSGPDAVGRLLGTGVTTGVRLACAAAAGIVFLACLRRVRPGGDWLGMAALAGLAGLCAIPSLVPWYVAWVLPAAALARGRGARVGVIVLTALLVITHLPILGGEAF